MDMDYVELTKKHFLDTVNGAGPEHSILLRHLPLVERWAEKIADRKPEARKDVVLMGVWLHDIGQIIGDKETDHAINSEAEARKYLGGLGVDEETINLVAGCARSHRCKDVQPETLEAKIVAVSDSASHMTDIVYADMAGRGDLEKAKGKLERDFRDVSLFPEIKEEVGALYQAWKSLLEAWPEM